MKPKRIIIDTGPLVAFLNRADRYHDWAVSKFSQLNPPFFTCESVLSEVCFLLRRSDNGPENALKLVERELIQIPFKLENEISAVTTLMAKYKNIPMSFADACLVRMSEQITESAVCTLDSDFKIYRKEKRTVIPLIMPEN